MIDHRTMQTFLKNKGYYAGRVDGIWGGKSVAAARACAAAEGVQYSQGWSDQRCLVAATQYFLVDGGYFRGFFDPTGQIDGRLGPDTSAALSLWRAADRKLVLSDEDVRGQPDRWPRQFSSEFNKLFGPPPAGQHGNLATITLPYPMRIAWDTDEIVTTTKCHKLIVEPSQAAFEEALAHYGMAGIRELGLDLYGGCYNPRKMRGGNSWSMHAWAVAWDIDPVRNQLKFGRDRAKMDDPEYKPFVDAFYRQGMINLGVERNRDWMHFQAARL